jgi:hypothetical protein
MMNNLTTQSIVSAELQVIGIAILIWKRTCLCETAIRSEGDPPLLPGGFHGRSALCEGLPGSA